MDPVQTIINAAIITVIGAILMRMSVTLRTELKAEISGLRTELKADIAELRTELKADIAELRTELKTDIADLRTELHAEIRGVRSDLTRVALAVGAEPRADHG